MSNQHPCPHTKHQEDCLRCLRTQRQELVSALEELLSCGISFEDHRVGYVEVQIEKEILAAARALLAKVREKGG